MQFCFGTTVVWGLELSRWRKHLDWNGGCFKPMLSFNIHQKITKLCCICTSFTKKIDVHNTLHISKIVSENFVSFSWKRQIDSVVVCRYVICGEEVPLIFYDFFSMAKVSCISFIKENMVKSRGRWKLKTLFCWNCSFFCLWSKNHSRSMRRHVIYVYRRTNCSGCE